MSEDTTTERGGAATKVALVVANVAIVVVTVLLCVWYVGREQAVQVAAVQDSFEDSVESMGRVASGTLTREQEACNDWATYIDAQDMTLEEAVAYLGSSSSTEGVVGHVVDYDTLQGLSSEADASGSTSVDYTKIAADFLDLVEAVRSGERRASAANMTPAYTSPTTALPTIGFLQDVTLRTADGGTRHALLVRCVLRDGLTNEWAFPTGYEKAELSLVNESGDYLFRSASLKNENLWEYVRIYNDIGYDGAEALRQELCSGGTHLRELLDSSHQPCYLVCTPAPLEGTDSSSCYFVGYVPVSSLATANVGITLVAIVVVGLAALLAIDGVVMVRLNRRLAQSAEEARRANEAKSQFLSSMSHDIRTPMNAIVGMTTIAARRLDNPQQMREALSKIALASNHLLTLINDILDISKIESGRVTLNPTVFSLSESFSELASIVRSQVKEKSLDLEIRVHQVSHEYLYADELRLNQVFINLASNAVKYTEPGGKVIVDLREDPCADDDGKVTLTYVVADTGIGMTPSFMDRMYESFSREGDGRTDKIQGTGLGLAIVKQMVDLMGGTIDCESEVGVGTTFTVRVDLAVAERMADDLMLPPLQLLLVDDDGDVLASAGETFASLGVKADVAQGGRRAVAMVRERHEDARDYQVVIVDWRMPDMDGVETTRAIRAITGDDVPIIVLSAYDWTEIEEEARAAGADAFIAKPLFRSTVYEKMSEVLGLGEERAASHEDEARGLRGLHLLVAEDNDINWEVIRGMLDMYDITVERAENGQTCVEMVEARDAGTFAAILMDVQMPVLDGRGATRAIRGLDDDAKRSIPIIAMTADAFAEDVQACLDAGMDGHVAKPVDLKKLFKELRDALHGGASRGSGPTDGTV